MTEEGKTVSAVLAAVFAVLGIFVFGIILEPLAIIAGVIGATSKKVGVKATGIAAAVIAFVLLMYLFIVLMAAQSALSGFGR